MQCMFVSLGKFIIIKPNRIQIKPRHRVSVSKPVICFGHQRIYFRLVAVCRDRTKCNRHSRRPVYRAGRHTKRHRCQLVSLALLLVILVSSFTVSYSFYGFSVYINILCNKMLCLSASYNICINLILSGIV